MKYIVIVHKEKDSCYGVTVPDYPGCYSAADSFDDIPSKVQESLECWAYGDDFIPAEPSTYEQVASRDDAKDGMLMLVDLDFDFADKKVVPVNVTMPRYMRAFIDNRARAMGLTRSAFLQKAAQHYGADSGD
ncbi:MAG: type II toxin-antitoxin system HicB family antitoxin [Mailhella sp.]|nr:type II toxin-antitoxin system HicB family antitoxin [Mailhella sp.]